MMRPNASHRTAARAPIDSGSYDGHCVANAYNLYAKLAHALDLEDLVEVLDCFSNAGEMYVSGKGVVSGRVDLERYLRQTAGNRPLHFFSNLYVHSAQGDTLSARTYLTLRLRGAGATCVIADTSDELVFDTDTGCYRFRALKIFFRWTSEDYLTLGRGGQVEGRDALG